MESLLAGYSPHVVTFYERDSDLVGLVAEYLGDALRADEAAIVIATEAHRHAFEAALEASDIDVAGARRRGTLVTLDAATTMALFTSDDEVDPVAFNETVGAVVRQAGANGRKVRAFGEMVALLWDAGYVGAAIELEEVWNDLCRKLPFSLFCAYHAGSVSASEHAEPLERVCHLHTSVIRPVAVEASSRFTLDLDSPLAARHFVVEVLSNWGYPEELIHDAALVATELATNAVLHAGTAFSVAVRSEASTVRISVEDGSSILPTVRDFEELAIGGRGMRIVAALASRWGVEVPPAGKAVWAELRA